MTSTPPRGQGWAAIRSRIAFAPAIVTTSARKGWSPGATTQAEVCAMPTSVPAVLAVWMQPFGCFFTPAVWRHVLVLVAGVVLAPGRRTVTAALRVMGLDQEAGFAVYHRGLSLGRWSSRACHPAQVVTLLISDVPGDDPINITSGPTVPDPTTCTDALAIIQRYGLDVPARVLEVLESGRGETVKPGDPRLAGIDTRMVATPQMALEAAAAVAQQAGVSSFILGDSIEGEARD